MFFPDRIFFLSFFLTLHTPCCNVVILCVKTKLLPAHKRPEVKRLSCWKERLQRKSIVNLEGEREKIRQGLVWRKCNCEEQNRHLGCLSVSWSPWCISSFIASSWLIWISCLSKFTLLPIEWHFWSCKSPGDVVLCLHLSLSLSLFLVIHSWMSSLRLRWCDRWTKVHQWKQLSRLNCLSQCYFICFAALEVNTIESE